MNNCFHASDLDRTITVQTNTVSVDGDITDSWGGDESVFAQMIFSGGEEKEEIGGPVNIERRRYKVMKEDRTWSPKNTRFKESDDTNYFYTTAFHPWKGSRLVYVIEGIQRDE